MRLLMHSYFYQSKNEDIENFSGKNSCIEEIKKTVSSPRKLIVQNEFKKALIALFTMKLIYCHTRQRLDDPPWAILRLTVRHEYHKVHKNKVILTGNKNILQGLASFLRPTGGALKETLITRQLRSLSISRDFRKRFHKEQQYLFYHSMKVCFPILKAILLHCNL